MCVCINFYIISEIVGYYTKRDRENEGGREGGREGGKERERESHSHSPLSLQSVSPAWSSLRL